MKEKLTYLWRARPQMSREMKTVRNLFILALAMLAWWWTARCPAFTAQGAVDKLSRQLMLPEGEIVERKDCWVLVKGEGYAYVPQMDCSVFRGVDANLVEGTKLGGEYALLRCPVEEFWGEWQPQENDTRYLACPQGPEVARRCTVDIRQTGWDEETPWEACYELEANREKSGAYLLKWVCEKEEDWDRARDLWSRNGVPSDQRATYVLRFYDSQGWLVKEQKGEFTYRW